MSRSRRTAVTREGWVYLAVLIFVLIGGLLRDINLLVAMAGLMFGPFVLSWWISRATLRGLSLQRVVPESISAGDPLVVELRLANPRRHGRAWLVVATDEILREATPHEATTVNVLFGHVRAGEIQCATYRGRLYLRGRYRFGPVRLVTRFPLGLVRSSVQLDASGETRVLPRLGRLTPKMQMLQVSAGSGQAHTVRRHGSLEGDFYGLREWRPGDPKRWIHWRTSARRQNLVVRQFAQPLNDDLAILLDLWQPAEPLAADLEHVEIAISFAASITAEVCRQGDRNLFVAATGIRPIHVGGPADAALMRRIGEHLAAAQATSDDAHVNELASAHREWVSCGATFVIGTRPAARSPAGQFLAPSRGEASNSRGGVRYFDTSSSELAEFFLPFESEWVGV